jgi:hypothetical protein
MHLYVMHMQRAWIELLLSQPFRLVKGSGGMQKHALVFHKRSHELLIKFEFTFKHLKNIFSLKQTLSQGSNFLS